MLQAGAGQRDIHQQSITVRLLHTLLECSQHAGKVGQSAAQHATGWADDLVPGVPALAQLLIVDSSVSQGSKGKQPMGQAPKPPAGPVDRVALQLEAAYLLLSVLDALSPQVRSPSVRPVLGLLHR